MENDTPLWHFDVEAADIPALLADPAKFFAGTAIAKAIAANNGVHEGTFVGGGSGGTTTRCCYTSGSQYICHNHTQ